MTSIKALILIMKKFPGMEIVYFKHKTNGYWFNVGDPDSAKRPRDGCFYILDDDTGNIQRYHKDADTGEITLAE